MKKLAITLLLLATPAFAQQPQQDPQIIVYRTLLSDANERLVQTIAQYERMVADLKKQNADMKAKCGAACEEIKLEPKK